MTRKGKELRLNGLLGRRGRRLVVGGKGVEIEYIVVDGARPRHLEIRQFTVGCVDSVD